MSLSIAVLYNEGDVYVEFTEVVFRELLQTYLEKYGSIDEAFDRIKLELKQKTRYK